MHAHVQDGTIRELYARLPASGRILATGELTTPPGGVWPPELAAACGFLEVAEKPRPPATATTTHDATVQLVDGAPTVVWLEREKTPEEIAADVAERNRDQIEATVDNMLSALQTIIDAPTASFPTVEAVKQLARSQRRIIRYLFNRLDAAE